MNDLPVPRPTDRAPACSCTPGITAPAAAGGRFGPTHALILLICFLALGSGLFLAGHPLDTVFALLGGLGAIGAATLTVAGSGRRLVTILAEAAVRSGAGK
jgi:CHASE2 domain-containing sensor protein